MDIRQNLCITEKKEWTTRFELCVNLFGKQYDAIYNG